MKLRKETANPDASAGALHGRWYRDACGTAFALEVIGERWSLLVVRELMLGALRFSDIRAGLPSISAKVLTERLAGLERAGVLRRRRLDPPVAVQVYELTEWGYLAEPLIQELGRWAARSPLHDPTLPLSPVAFMLSLRTMLDDHASLDCDIGFVIAGQTFRARLAGGDMPVTREPVDGAGAVFRAPDAALLAARFYGDVPPRALPGLVIEGDVDLAQRFVGLFALPPKAG
ncbi:winged helix-turn-helix transcriptional regulator [Aurantiacibacter spongiae]|uniref:Transcriptional regulator n=1 Tax=Aurantiacibacter spongiae TaxID=2488860 RepID=A0A3N5CT19_9SPHN|nr:helix-turn-helix domain-containing protein [Aurantiacibacter spongiae]RPF72323.1 transcriptional regulator [Aurantiacibacter spongiae]